MRIGVLNGPKLDRLGERDPGHYGTRTLNEISDDLVRRADGHGVELRFYQSDDESALADWIRDTSPQLDGLVINAGRLTHSSDPLRSAVAAAAVPFVEVHLSNIFARKAFRHHSVLSDLAVGIVVGFKGDSYLLGLDALVRHLRAPTR